MTKATASLQIKTQSCATPTKTTFSKKASPKLKSNRNKSLISIQCNWMQISNITTYRTLNFLVISPSQQYFNLQIILKAFLPVDHSPLSINNPIYNQAWTPKSPLRQPRTKTWRPSSTQSCNTPKMKS